MTLFVTFLISGLGVGAAYALVGSGFVVVHRVTHVVNFTQGTFAVVAGMLASKLITSGTPHGIGELLAVLVAGVAGLCVGAITLARRDTPPFVALLITLGLVFVGLAINITAFGQNPAPSVPILTGSIDLFGAQTELQRLIVVPITLVVFIILGQFFERTDVGRAMTATASNRRAAQLVGISYRRMGLAAFAIGGLLGGIAGVLVAPSQQLSPYQDIPLAISGFSAAVFGNLSNPWLTLVGGLLLGVVGQLLQGYGFGSFQTQVSLILMLIILIVRARALNAQEEAK
ncbi:MAG: branched-chain amino acid ABC transporter permease [Pseudolysinimonas sp.]